MITLDPNTIGTISREPAEQQKKIERLMLEVCLPFEKKTSLFFLWLTHFFLVGEQSRLAMDQNEEGKEEGERKEQGWKKGRQKGTRAHGQS